MVNAQYGGNVEESGRSPVQVHPKDLPVVTEKFT
jgi:hypothetical protein